MNIEGRGGGGKCVEGKEKRLSLPLLPGTRTIYSTSGSSGCWVGLRGYAGGLEAIAVIDDRDLASTGPWPEATCAMDLRYCTAKEY